MYYCVGPLRKVKWANPGSLLVSITSLNGPTERTMTKAGSYAMYIARDKNNDLYLFNEMPSRGKECWWASSELDGSYLRLDKSIYPEVTWDSKPLKIEIRAVMDS